jgi:hypothetical protein
MGTNPPPPPQNTMLTRTASLQLSSSFQGDLTNVPVSAR